jgi:hypothetical protein
LLRQVSWSVAVTIWMPAGPAFLAGTGDVPGLTFPAGWAASFTVRQKSNMTSLNTFTFSSEESQRFH